MAEINQRVFVRINRRFTVSYCTTGAFLRMGANSKNISEGGIAIPLSQNIPVGTLLDIEIRSDDINGSIKALARVIWVERRPGTEYPFEGGMQFVEIDPAQLERLRAYIKSFTIRLIP